MSVIVVLGIPTEFGVPLLLTREVAAAQAAGDLGRVHGVVRWATRAVLLTSFVTGMTLVGWMVVGRGATDSALGMTLICGIVMIPLIALAKVQGATLRGLQDVVAGQAPDVVVRPALFSTLLFAVPALVARPLDSALAMGLGALSAAAALIASFALLRRKMPAISKPSHQRFVSMGLWAAALPMGLTQGMRILQANLTLLLLGYFSSGATVGLYRVATSVALVVAVPITIFNLIGAPIVTRLFTEGDMVRLQRMLAWMALGMFVSTSLLTLPFIVAGEFIFGATFGAEFASCAPILLVLCIGVIVNGFFGLNATLLNMTGHQVRVTRASAISFAVLVLLAPACAWAIGPIGAAAAVTVALVAWSLSMWVDASRLLHIDTTFWPLLRARLRADG